MMLEFEVDVDYLTDGGIKGMPTWVKLNDEDGEHASTVYVNSSSYWHVVDDNAKLRELVRDMWEGYNDPRCEECHLKDTSTCADCPICAREASVINRMRELGVEVDE